MMNALHRIAPLPAQKVLLVVSLFFWGGADGSAATHAKKFSVIEPSVISLTDVLSSRRIAVPSSSLIPMPIPEALYLSGRSKPKKFSIELRDCNPEVFRGISVTFSGSEDAELADHLALDSSDLLRPER
jgi:hypothetical protein